MTFPLFYLLLPYLALILLWALFCGVALYHIFKFGHKTPAIYLATAVFLLVSAAMLSVSFYYIAGIEWNREITVLEVFFEKL